MIRCPSTLNWQMAMALFIFDASESSTGSNLFFIQPLRLEKLTRIVAVDVFCHGRQRTKIDAVSDFQHIEIVITDIHSQHVGDAGPVACSCAHPYDIVISPLEIHIVIIHEKVHDEIRMRSSVPNIPDNVQTIYCQ